MNNEFVVKFKKLHPDGQLPKANDSTYGSGDTGYDVYAVEDKLIEFGKPEVVETGIQVAYITPGYWFKIEARSGLGFKHGIAPHFGIVDVSYRGNLGIKMYRQQEGSYQIKKGDRIAQLVFYKLLQPTVEWSDTIEETVRGSNGFGSSDQKN